MQCVAPIVIIIVLLLQTTLLDVLAFRKTTGTVEGVISLSGFPATADSLARCAGYCEQEDVHLPTATVREALEFSAALRLPRSLTAAQRAGFVHATLELLELDRIGGRLVDSLSPAERKRLTIGVEMAANPAMLLLDEPTTVRVAAT